MGGLMSAERKEKLDLKGGAEVADQSVVMPQAPGVEKSLLSMMTIDPTNIVSQCISDGMTADYF